MPYPCLRNSGFLVSASHDLSTLSARPCHPLPVARRPSATSGESRIEMGTFLGVFCGPRLRSFRSIFCSASGSVEKGFKRATSSAFISRTSPSLSINGLRFAIESSLSLVGLAETDDANSVRFGDVAKQMQPLVQIPNRNASRLAVADFCDESCPGEIKSAARSNESPRSRILRSFFAGHT
jgi:hypothetical protein